MRRLYAGLAFAGFLLALSPLALRTLSPPSVYLPSSDTVAAACDAVTTALAAIAAPGEIDANAARLLPMRPSGVHFEFYIVTEAPQTGVVNWEFESRLLPMLQPFLRVRRPLYLSY